MCESNEDAELTFKSMQEMGGHAQAAANQILRVGPQERGSILSTAYRQIDWMADINIQESLNESTFDIAEFLKGDMDIYVVLPTDQIQEKSRLFRILLSILKYFPPPTTAPFCQKVWVPSSRLPQKMVFVYIFLLFALEITSL